jgi:hypothetical protein
MCTTFWLENLKGRDHPEDLGVDVSIMLMELVRLRVRTGFICLRMGTSEGI